MTWRKGQKLVNYFTGKGVSDENMHRTIFYMSDRDFDMVINEVTEEKIEQMWKDKNIKETLTTAVTEEELKTVDGKVVPLKLNFGRVIGTATLHYVKGDKRIHYTGLIYDEEWKKLMAKEKDKINEMNIHTP